MSYLAETEFLFSIRPKDQWNKMSRRILHKAKREKIQIRFLESALQEMRTVLYSQDKSPRDAYMSLIFIKKKLGQYGILDEAMSIDDDVLADKLREDFGELTYFDSLHAAAALRRNQILLTNDKVYRTCEVKTITFRELASQKLR